MVGILHANFNAVFGIDFDYNLELLEGIKIVFNCCCLVNKLACFLINNS